MKRTVKLDEETLTELKKFGGMGQSWDDVVKVVLERVTKFTKSTDKTEFKEAKVDQWGKAPIGRPHKNKTIRYQVME